MGYGELVRIEELAWGASSGTLPLKVNSTVARLPSFLWCLILYSNLLSTHLLPSFSQITNITAIQARLLRYAGIESQSSLNHVFHTEPISSLFPFPYLPEPGLLPSGSSADSPSAICCHPFIKPCPKPASILDMIVYWLRGPEL